MLDKLTTILDFYVDLISKFMRENSLTEYEVEIDGEKFVFKFDGGNLRMYKSGKPIGMKFSLLAKICHKCFGLPYIDVKNLSIDGQIYNREEFRKQLDIFVKLAIEG